jgi:hypothetical protein
MFKAIDESAVENRQEMDYVAVFIIAMMVCVSYSVSEEFIICITCDGEHISLGCPLVPI